MDDREVKATEKKIKNYFLRLKKIEIYKGRIKDTEESLDKVRNDIGKSNINLSVSYSSIDYSKDNVQGSSSIYNGIEKEIESVFDKLEKQEKQLKEKLVNLKANISILESENKEIERVLNNLDEESKKIISLKYKESKREKTLESIAYELHLSKSSIARKKDQILKDITEWLYSIY